MRATTVVPVVVLVRGGGRSEVGRADATGGSTARGSPARARSTPAPPARRAWPAQVAAAGILVLVRVDEVRVAQRREGGRQVADRADGIDLLTDAQSGQPITVDPADDDAEVVVVGDDDHRRFGVVGHGQSVVVDADVAPAPEPRERHPLTLPRLPAHLAL